MKVAMSLRTKMILAFLGVVLISVIPMTIMSYRVSRDRLTAQAGKDISTLAQSQSIMVANEITKQVDLMVTLSQSGLLQDTLVDTNASYHSVELDPATLINQLDQAWRSADAANNNEDPLVKKALSNELAADLKNFKLTFPHHAEVFVTDKFGALVASTGRTSDYNQADEGWWQTTYNSGKGGNYIGQPEFDESSQSHAVILGVPVINKKTGEVIGVLRSTYDMEGFNLILASAHFGETGQADLVFPSGTVVGSATNEACNSCHQESVDGTSGVGAVTSGNAPGTMILSSLKENSDGYGVLNYKDKLRVVSQALVSSTGSGQNLQNLFSELNWYLIVYQDSEEILKPIENLTNMILLISLGVLLIVTFLALLAARYIGNPITRLTAVAEKFAEGDLEAQAEVESNDEIGRLAETFNNMTGQLQKNLENEQSQRQYLQETIAKYADFTSQVMRGKLATRLSMNGSDHDQEDPLVQLGKKLNEMTASLHGMITQTREAANNLSSAATEILAATTQQSSGAAEQSAAITQTTSTVNEVKAISEHSTARLYDVVNASQRTVEITRFGQNSVQDMIESMAQIKERVEAIAENTLALSEQTQQIGEIITTVNEIAAQSNILALNASVEAARAGEHGKGFAVVAAEVRNLAEQSKQATAQVKTILSEIQKATNLTVMATEEGAKGVDAGVQLAAQARDSINKLSGSVNEATQVATQVVAGGQQLQTGIEQIALAIQQINQVTVQGLSSTRQTEKSAQNLNELARRLSEDIAQYEL